MAKDKKLRKKNTFIYLAAIAVIAVIAFLVFFIGKKGSSMLNDKIIMPDIYYETVSKASFHSTGKYIYYASKDGIQLLDKQGNRVWDDIFTMQQPVLLGNLFG